MGCSGSREGKRGCYGLSVSEPKTTTTKGGPLGNELKRVKSLSEMSLPELMTLLDLVRAKVLEDERAAASTLFRKPPKTVYLKLTTHVAEPVPTAPPLLSMSLNINHLEPSATTARLKELNAPADSVCAISLDLPLSDAKNVVLNVGKLVGKIFLILDQKEVVDAIKASLPTYIGKARAVVKDESGRSVLRISFFFSDAVLGFLDHLTMLQHAAFNFSINEAVPQDDHKVVSNMNEATPDALHDEHHQQETPDGTETPSGDLGDDLVVIPDSTTPGGPARRTRTKRMPVLGQENELQEMQSYPSIFAKFPDRECLAFSATVEAKIQKSIVAYIHKFLAENGYAATAMVSNDPEEGSAESSLSLAHIITFLTLLNHVESTVRFESAQELFEQFHSLHTVADTLSKLQSYPGETLNKAIVGAFKGMNEETTTKSETQYADIVKMMGECFAGHLGTYHLRILSRNTSVKVSLQGINPWPLFPSVPDIRKAVEIAREQDREAARQLDAALSLGLKPFEAHEFDDIMASIKLPVRDPWELVYPPPDEPSAGEGLVKVWVNNTDPDKIPVLHVEGIMNCVTAEQAFLQYHDKRMDWDKYIAKCEVLQEFKDIGADVTSTIYLTPFMFKNIEFVEYRQFKRMSDDSILMLSRSCEHEKRPRDSSFTRGRIWSSAYHFKTMTNPKDRMPYTIVTGMLKQETGLSLPPAMLNQLNNTIIADWMHNFIGSVVYIYEDFNRS